MKRINFLLAFVFIFVNFSGLAQETDDLLNMSLEELMNVNIQVASTKGDNIFSSPSTVSIISREQIEKYNFASIEEALQTVAGIKIYRTYLKRNLPTSRGIIQDHYANKTLILINGIPIWNAVTGEGNLDRININEVERIEILKGPASMLYGTNAYSGAINLVLKKEEKTTYSLFGGYGMNNSYEAGANAFIKINDLETFIAVNSSNNRGPERNWTDERNVTKKIDDHLKSENVTLNIKYRSHNFLMNAYQGAESYYGVTPSYKAGAGVDHKLNGYCINYNFNKKITDKFNLLAGATYDYNSRDLARDSMNNTRSLINGDRLRFDIRENYTFFNDRFMFELGADYELRKSINYSNYDVVTDTLKDRSGLKDKSLSEFSIFSQLRFTKDKFNFLAGTRFTNNELFGTNLSSRLTAVYTINPKNSIKLIYGESYRAPSFFEYYFFQETGAAKTVFGNKALKPEKSKSLELAYLKAFDDFFLQALIYHGIYENKIYRSKSDTSIIVPDGHSLGYYTTATNKPTIYVNGNDFAATGLEFELQYSNPKIINAFFNLNYIIGDKGDIVTMTDKTGNVIEPYNFRFVPDYTLAIGFSRGLGKIITISGVYNFMSSIDGPYSTIQNQQTLDLNIGISHKVKGIKFSHTISAKNIFDENILCPEYTRMYNVVNAIPYGTYRYISYTLKLTY